MKGILYEYFYPEKLYIDRMNDKNRNNLFVEVDQPELTEKIFRPLYNVKKKSYRFFYKRYAILGDFKVGKTELGTYIIKKIEECYTSNNLISITINTEEARTKTTLNIKSWIYRQWLTKLRQVDHPGFKSVVLRTLRDFEEERGYKYEDINREDFLDILYLITKIYKEYRKVNKEAKYIVEFDQANVIYRNEEEFLPFYQFWRNFQGYWEDKQYFANIGLFIFVIGHINWKDYASLKDPSGEGIFDDLVSFKHWTNSDVYKMLEKRLKYALKNEHEEEITYFLPKGIVNFLRNKLGKVNVYEYLKYYLGPDGYLRKFFKNFKVNKRKYKDLLEFCNKVHQKTEMDNTYFREIERLFIDNVDSDYMQVFKYLSNHQNEPWFNDLFKLIDKSYEEEQLLFGSTFFNKELKNLEKDFLSLKFSYDIKHGSNPELMPPIFADYERNLMLDRAFKEKLSAVPSDRRGGATLRLRKYIQSQRIMHKDFLESRDGKEMKSLLIENVNITEDIMKIFDEWVKNGYHGIISKKLEYGDKIRTDFLAIQNRTFNIYQLYDGNSTKWVLFDDNVRTLGIFITEDLLPKKSQIKDYIDLSEFKDEIRSPLVSNIEITRILNAILSKFLDKIKIFDGVIKEKNKSIKSSQNYEDQVLFELLEIIKKYQGKEIQKSDFLKFLNQFPDRLRMSVLNFLNRLIYFTNDELIESLRQEIDKIPYTKSTKIHLGIFDDLVNKSNSYCSYLMKKTFKNQCSIDKTSELIEKLEKLIHEKDIRIIFIDDVIGTGQQFIESYKKYFEKHFIERKYHEKSNIRLYLVACIGSEESREYISENSYLNEDAIRYVRTIRNKDKAFYKNNWKDKEELEDLKKFLKSKDPKYWDGWKADLRKKGLEYLVVMEWNTPNTTISCLWKDTSEWKALFPRS